MEGTKLLLAFLLWTCPNIGFLPFARHVAPETVFQRITRCWALCPTRPRACPPTHISYPVSEFYTLCPRSGPSSHTQLIGSEVDARPALVQSHSSSCSFQDQTSRWGS